MKNPNAGDIMQGTGGIRKLRWVLPNKGKSGGVRVIYIDFISYGKIYLLDLYGKAEKEDLPQNEKKELKKLVKNISVIKKGRKL